MDANSIQILSFTLDMNRMCLRGPSGTIPLRPKCFDVLRHLCEHAGRVVPKDELLKAVWPEVTVNDEALARCVCDIRQALGDNQRRIIKTIARRGYLLDVLPSRVGIGHPTTIVDEDEASAPKPTPSPTNQRQRIDYCRTSDGVRLAYAVAGDGSPFVKAGNWLHHLEHDWESPVWRHLLQGLASKHSLIRYDARGNGLSDWEVDELSLDAWVCDLEAVVNASGVKRFPLLGVSQGCCVSVAYAVRHPERVSHLILYGGYIRGAKKRTPEERDKRNAMLTLARLEWGSSNPAFRQLFTGNFIPGATGEQADCFNELQRKTTSPACAARYMDVTGDLDITELLCRVKAPTLVMHARGDRMVPFACGEELAAGIPGARFVALEGVNHFFLEHEPASRRFLEEIDLFLGRDNAARRRATPVSHPQ